MKRFLLGGAALVLGANLPASLSASSDLGCTPAWTLVSRALDCSNRAFLTPGNDTRVNLLMLLRDRAGLSDRGVSVPKTDYTAQDFGATFLDWDVLQGAYWRDVPAMTTDSEGSRCASLAGGEAAFGVALAAERGLSAAERTGLGAARARLAATCKAETGAGLLAWPVASSVPGKAFLGYLQSADAFYAGRWDGARAGFAALRSAPNPWVAETARYMLARTELNAAIEPAIGDYGWLDDMAKVDKAGAMRGLNALADYLKAYPTGAYAPSAIGLVRRGMWLAGETRPLAHTYERLLTQTRADNPATPPLIEETDNKLLTRDYAKSAIDGPLLLATLDLMRMRRNEDEDGKIVDAPSLGAQELAGQQAAFAGRADLYDFLRASHAFYVGNDARAVLKLVPDDARHGAASPLGFSRQVLRGIALAALKDPNEAGFWRELMAGASGPWQRPTIELALARNFELAGRSGDVFAPASPVLDPTIRGILLQTLASPEVLRADARSAGRPQRERDIAAFTLLYKELSRGRYADFAADTALVRKGADTGAGLYDLDGQEAIPAGLFTAGLWSDGYACPAIARTAATLARGPGNVSARLCLGDFWRLNGFDQFTALDQPRAAGTLGSGKPQFPGAPLARMDIYTALIADPRVSASDKAYALYRAVGCYGPSGYNSCGGADVDSAQRKAWFNRLKSEFPATSWAKKARYYW